MPNMGTMDDTNPELTVELCPRIAQIPAAAWDELAGGDNPFISHAFLSALEESGSVGGDSGWRPVHTVLRDETRRLVGVVPLYAKAHSYGEYVFDHAWADALERAGGQYYPKLQGAVPFSPVPGPRLLLRPGIAPSAMAEALEAVAAELRVSSVHVTFCTEQEWRGLGEAGWLLRQGTQFHWDNQGYADFEGFLGALASRKRKAIRRERRDAQAGLEFSALSGAELTERVWDAFYEFYLATVDRKWGGAYLTRGFFSILGERMGENIVLMVARRGGRIIAGALNLRGADTLYGRNWGAAEDIPFLHFELCYYQAIDYAIAHGLARVEAGAQGMHKIQRGYLPTPTYSAHWIAHKGLRRAVASFLEDEGQGIAAERAALMQASPYRQE
jgi:uncharacterized protein